MRNSQRKNQELDEAKSRQAAVPPSKPEKNWKKPEIRSELKSGRKSRRTQAIGTRNCRVKIGTGNNTVRSKKKEKPKGGRTKSK